LNPTAGSNNKITHSMYVHICTNTESQLAMHLGNL